MYKIVLDLVSNEFETILDSKQARQRFFRSSLQGKEKVNRRDSCDQINRSCRHG